MYIITKLSSFYPDIYARNLHYTRVTDPNNWKQYSIASLQDNPFCILKKISQMKETYIKYTNRDDDYNPYLTTRGTRESKSYSRREVEDTIPFEAFETKVEKFLNGQSEVNPVFDKKLLLLLSI